MHKLQIYRNDELVGTIGVMRLPTGREVVLCSDPVVGLGPYEEIEHFIIKLPVKHRFVRISHYELNRHGVDGAIEKHSIPDYATREVDFFGENQSFRWPVGFIEDDDLMDDIFDFEDFEPADTEPYRDPMLGPFDFGSSKPVEIPMTLPGTAAKELADKMRETILAMEREVYSEPAPEDRWHSGIALLRS